MTVYGESPRKDQCGPRDTSGTSSSTEESHRQRHCRAGGPARWLEAGLRKSPASFGLLRARVRGDFHRHGDDGELRFLPFHRILLRECYRPRTCKQTINGATQSGPIIGTARVQKQRSRIGGCKTQDSPIEGELGFQAADHRRGLAESMLLALEGEERHLDSLRSQRVGHDL